MMKTIILTSALISMILFVRCTNETTTSKPKNAAERETTSSQSKNHEMEKRITEELSSKKIDTPDQKRIRELIGFKGNINEYIEWTDSIGQHIVIASKKDIYWTDSDFDVHDLQNAQVSCYHYLQKVQNATYERVWKILDHSKDCPVDAIATFKKGVLQQTDLNKNGIAEIWTLYYIACKGDVSPSILKLIMYEGETKYKMTGETRVHIGNGDYEGGNIDSEGKFKDEPLFLEFAKALWKKNNNEVFGE